MHRDENINTVSLQMEYDPPLLGLFGGPSGSMSMTNTNIQVNTSQKEATDTLSAKLTGKVNIQFKTDYFKLDNFANMYADGGVAAIKPPAQGGGVPGLPSPQAMTGHGPGHRLRLDDDGSTRTRGRGHRLVMDTGTSSLLPHPPRHGGAAP